MKYDLADQKLIYIPINWNGSKNKKLKGSLIISNLKASVFKNQPRQVVFNLFQFIGIKIRY